MNYFLGRVRNGHRINLQIETLCTALFDQATQVREIALETLKRYRSGDSAHAHEIDEAIGGERIGRKKELLILTIREHIEQNSKEMEDAERERVIKTTIDAETIGRINELLEIDKKRETEK